MIYYLLKFKWCDVFIQLVYNKCVIYKCSFVSDGIVSVSRGVCINVSNKDDLREMIFYVNISMRKII